jgi:hypothetical protein
MHRKFRDGERVSAALPLGRVTTGRVLGAKYHPHPISGWLYCIYDDRGETHYFHEKWVCYPKED